MSEINSISPLDIAGYFIKLSGEEGLTNLKLNKLIYMAHGFYWGNFEKPLITDGELAEAWKHGPVYRSVYNVFGGFKADIIPAMYAYVSTKLDSFDKEVSTFLAQFWNIFKEAPPWYLVDMLHEKNSPWYIVWHLQGGKRTSGSPISDHLTKAYYIDQVNKLKSLDVFGASLANKNQGRKSSSRAS